MDITQLYVHIFLLCTYVLHGTGLSCQSCGWLQPSVNSKPAVALTFLHMRKSGGTNFLHTFKYWMQIHKCLEGMKVKSHGQFGIKSGYYMQHKQSDVSDAMCPQVDLKHTEYFCYDIDSYQSLPPLAKRGHIPFRMLTILRHPIDRIISQAMEGIRYFLGL